MNNLPTKAHQPGNFKVLNEVMSSQISLWRHVSLPNLLNYVANNNVIIVRYKKPKPVHQEFNKKYI